MSSLLNRSLIKNLDLFRSLSEAELDQALKSAQSILLQEGSTVFTQGEAADRFFVLLHGHLKVVQVTPDGEQVTVRYVSPGEVFGIARAMRRSHYPATTLAVQESIVLAWPSSEWDQFIAGNPQFAFNALQTVGQRLQDAHSRIRELSTEEVEQRVARAILRLVDQSGAKTSEGIEISFPITRQDIAEMTGTTLHTVSRLLSQWKDRGLVNSGRKRITVRSLDELIRLAEGPQIQTDQGDPVRGVTPS
ncbi:Crp/Fnr family transcriptional regulator [Parapusillimonas granuli]|uniref:Crp/Fnr family transcriptional regulator n=1 Tax=Parapusillimonas granuli TaxID=380911 RepID=A0A853G0Q0_9BURK|nr:Crp/Fnr family transcriptional regulator [Parapusillimonas granuli]MBB5215474.1 CRP-like cAMP-binding protein [Parapusillimonas granuli]MEB2400311.1 Crp/Fnr family transcriptional regulator [Alcaligenaceae bacterium]NYT49859.1 Crp/Fnr family transcriptional regulator [Parapusillimonas granuli]